MENFINYLLSEYKLPSDVVCNNVIYSYSTQNKIDKKSKTPITNHVITVKIESYDKAHNKLATNTEHFINGKIQRPKAKKLINISPDELNNKFGLAKSDICALIKKQNSDKVNELTQIIDDITGYVGHDVSIIPNEFVNEHTITQQEPKKNKQFEF